MKSTKVHQHALPVLTCFMACYKRRRLPLDLLISAITSCCSAWGLDGRPRRADSAAFFSSPQCWYAPRPWRQGTDCRLGKETRCLHGIRPGLGLLCRNNERSTRVPWRSSKGKDEQCYLNSCSPRRFLRQPPCPLHGPTVSYSNTEQAA
jgi:hypothetical protein